MDVLTMGRVITDIYANELHLPLEKVTSFNKYLGGSAGNMAVGLARLGAKTGLISRVGDDAFGNFLLTTLADEGVDTTMVKADPTHPTPLAFAALFPPADSQLLFYGRPAAYSFIDPGDLDEKLIRQARLLVLGGTALCASPSREAVFAALELNRASGGTNAMDVDWRPLQWEDRSQAVHWYQRALSELDIVIANETELAFLGGTDDAEAAARAILVHGPKQVIAKRGGEGVLVFGEGEPLTVPPFQVEVMNTLGAGDAFGAGFSYGLLQGWPLVRCLTYANACGAIVVSRHACSAAMPTLAEVEELIQRQGRWLW